MIYTAANSSYFVNTCDCCAKRGVQLKKESISRSLLLLLYLVYFQLPNKSFLTRVPEVHVFFFILAHFPSHQWVGIFSFQYLQHVFDEETFIRAKEEHIWLTVVVLESNFTNVSFPKFLRGLQFGGIPVLEETKTIVLRHETSSIKILDRISLQPNSRWRTTARKVYTILFLLRAVIFSFLSCLQLWSRKRVYYQHKVVGVRFVFS